MTGEAILVAGKALIWFALPLGLACREIWKLRRERREEQRGTLGD